VEKNKEMLMLEPSDCIDKAININDEDEDRFDERHIDKNIIKLTSHYIKTSV